MAEMPSKDGATSGWGSLPTAGEGFSLFGSLPAECKKPNAPKEEAKVGDKRSLADEDAAVKRSKVDEPEKDPKDALRKVWRALKVCNFSRPLTVREQYLNLGLVGC